MKHMTVRTPLIPDLREIYDIGMEITFTKLCGRITAPDGYSNVDISLDVFQQTWPNNGGGMANPHWMHSQILTQEYTTVVTACKFELHEDRTVTEDRLYVVFFGNNPAYLVTKATPEFLEDFKNRNLLGRYDALTKHCYGKTEAASRPDHL